MELLKELLGTFGPSGRETEICKVIKKAAENYADEITEDALGNLIVHKKGTKKKIMLASHADEIGVIVTFVDEKGFLRFQPVGGLNKKDLQYRRVRFENGTIGVIGSEPENKDSLYSKMYIDIGAKTRKEAEKLISIGDMAVFEGEMHMVGNRIVSKALDNRIGCYCLLEVLKNAKSENDLYFVFTVQEEVGLRGAKTSAYRINPDFAIAVDVTDTGDTPETDEMAVSLGGGAAVKVMDHSVLCDSFVRSRLIECAKDKGIKYQLEVMPDGGTDAGAISLTREGVKTGGVSIPCRYVHSPSEMVDTEDVKAAIELISEFIK